MLILEKGSQLLEIFIVFSFLESDFISDPQLQMAG